MADNGELREDLKVPDGELGSQLRADHEAGKELLVCMETSVLLFVFRQRNCANKSSLSLQCTVLKSCGEECVIAIKTNTALDK